MQPTTGMPQQTSPTATPPARDGKRIAAAGLFLVGGVLALVSAFVGWWYLSASGLTVTFLPGSSDTASSSGTSVTMTYASEQLGQVGGVYEAILAIAIVAGVLAIVAGILGIVAGFGRLPQRRHGTVKGLAIAAIVLAVVIVGLAPAMQPWAINASSNHSVCSSFTGTSPCNSFWGSQSVLGTSYSWGATTGWYLALAAIILGIVGLILWRAGPSKSTSPASP